MEKVVEITDFETTEIINKNILNDTELYSIIKKSSIKIYNDLGYGLSELAYEKALSEELRDHGLHTQTEVHINQYYYTSNGRKIEVANLRIDILVDDCLILELKTLDNHIRRFDKDNNLKDKLLKETKEYHQCKRYMHLMNIKQCILINFSKKGLEFIIMEE